MKLTVSFSYQARDQLLALNDYLAEAASPEIADRYTDAIVDFCLSLETFPERGVRRDDVRAGLRITSFRGRTVIAYLVDAVARKVWILGVFHGGQDYENVLR